ncbi:hypothetical protein DESUT3_17860 [Desulfuromonas versatilis]|uniref:Flagellar basal body rod protein n=1 Tax=Desulfuromonas versatilis TaxID=2802975 RepID=A0ABN6DXX6_9BACT|nr:flagellar basal body rod C-terminal domain-containing protein [Desulfuromonas versatilis]BCR04717.1 hypothetical protein DESUT3_17860 [Desulfuromonas versatilis]
MIKSMDTSVSGLRAMAGKLAVHADNIANAASDGFKKSRTILAETEAGGVTARVEKVQEPGPVIQETSGERELSNVDLAEEAVAIIPTKAFYTANLKVLETSDQMIGSLIDIKG